MLRGRSKGFSPRTSSWGVFASGVFGGRSRSLAYQLRSLGARIDAPIQPLRDSDRLADNPAPFSHRKPHQITVQLTLLIAADNVWLLRFTLLYLLLSDSAYSGRISACFRKVMDVAEHGGKLLRSRGLRRLP